MFSSIGTLLIYPPYNFPSGLHHIKRLSSPVFVVFHNVYLYLKKVSVTSYNVLSHNVMPKNVEFLKRLCLNTLSVIACYVCFDSRQKMSQLCFLKAGITIVGLLGAAQLHSLQNTWEKPEKSPY